MEGLSRLASDPVALGLVFVLIAVAAAGFFGIPFNRRHRFLKTFGVEPPPEGSARRQIVQADVVGVLAAGSGAIATIDAEIAQVVGMHQAARSQQAVDTRASLTKIAELEEEKQRLANELETARGLARDYRLLPEKDTSQKTLGIDVPFRAKPEPVGANNKR